MTAPSAFVHAVRRASLATLAILTLLLIDAEFPLERSIQPGSVEIASAVGGPAVSIVAWADFPKTEPRGAELSGIAWDDATRTLYAITDDSPRIIPIRPSTDYRTWTFGEPIAVGVPVDWDGEGIVFTPNGFIISNEFGPSIFAVDRGGEAVEQIDVPAHFTRIVRNRGFEALALSPDGRYLFAANESPLEGDGPQPSADAGGVVRILRIDRTSGAVAEFAYRTDPIPVASEGADRGLVELVALSATDLLAMERSFIPAYGNNVRIYRVDLNGAVDVLNVETLSDVTPVVAKQLLVDLSDLNDAAFPEPRQPQPNRILDNFEGMALGPVLADGRRILFVVSDDNKRETQTARILVLAVAGLP